jgi:hypothetical protein
MKKIVVVFILSFYFQLLNNKILGQAFLQDSNTYDLPQKNAIEFYYKSFGQNAHLYNGSEYVTYDVHIKGNPYFLPDMQSGALYYDGMGYENLPMIYDILHDELIINRYTQNFRIRLVNEKTSYFSLGNHFFIRIAQDTADNPVILTGYYERLYAGNITVLAKRRKRIEETVLAEGVSSQFIEDDLFYIKKYNIYYTVRNKRTVLEIFKERKKDIQKFLRKNKIKFKKNPEYAIVRMTEFYDQIKN